MPQDGNETILVVDDRPENCHLLDVLLTSKGYKTMIASNGVEALECMSEKIPDLIISDILMPVMDGFVFCKKCKSNPKLSTIPFIFYTATYTSEKDEDFAISLGADKFIRKPVETEKFLKCIEDILENYKKGKIQGKLIKDSVKDEIFIQQYNQALICKLEEKVQELDDARASAQMRENLLRAILNATPDLIFVLNEEGNFIEVMTKNIKLLHKTVEELLGKNIKDVMPDNIASKTMQCIKAAINDNKIYTLQYQIPTTSINRWYEAKFSLINDCVIEDKKLIVVTVRDITTQKTLENELKLINLNLSQRIEDEIKRRERQEKAAIQQARFSAMSDMLISISHHWRQPLNAIGLLLQNIKDEFDIGMLTSEKLARDVYIGMDKLNELSSTITKFMHLIKPVQDNITFDVKRAIVNVVELLKPQLDESSIECRVFCKNHTKYLYEDEPFCCVDTIVFGSMSSLQDCFVRLIVNAQHAIDEARSKAVLSNSEKGYITISVLRSSKKIFITIQDNGCKIKDELLDKIFEPYVTGQESVVTHGIGLYVAKMTIEHNFNGHISAINNDIGACFTVELNLFLNNAQV